ncbi:sugar 3,4-ketoisomerase [Proteus terrae]|uniref:QdtA n=1 Tax=Proteus vulgaris TaxID=585 RepID=A0A385JMY0_PROVU|nr:FdtA/QdtA family cupin domain-containing protein [Proteus terrae]AXY99709.1 qdtA [Proteus vulgaris]QKD71055.1 WxcM-like domain-containing protein [Proteus terrae subsp. cibarius]QKD72882.1 WxcM-like domain-containing protein [Proteus terrae subsp. cibarius]UDF26033.1 FdtA/QdtA family cupin domain-containing protein [Proteus terrae subsp. cibarius]WCG86962.1 FdtA/QdtA family cupin domain-containing protein [Proteus terrae]
MKLVNIIDFNILGDERGSLISLEENNNIPFEIKRVYYIFGTKDGVSRGFHAHKELKQLAVCVRGSCRFIMDDGTKREELILDKPNLGLLINPMQWHEMHDFSEDCIIIVLANDYYDESDYIRDYDSFIKSE